METQPITDNHCTMEAHIGRDTFQDALDAWGRTQRDGAPVAWRLRPLVIPAIRFAPAGMTGAIAER
ncbi:MAG TPA: hypothetical protein VG900_02595 [Hyphomicrobiaceae bacterium]|nr:hypothetical protein [Hyphomicrobiaceae bacterium]